MLWTEKALMRQEAVFLAKTNFVSRRRGSNLVSVLGIFMLVSDDNGVLEKNRLI